MGNYDDWGHTNPERIGESAYRRICPRKRSGYKSGEGMHMCPAVHAEMNVVLQAARLGIATEGATLYCYCGVPCKDCAKELINAGIKRVVYLTSGNIHPDSGKKGYNFPLSFELFRLAGVEVDNVVPLAEGGK